MTHSLHGAWFRFQPLPVNFENLVSKFALQIQLDRPLHPGVRAAVGAARGNAARDGGLRGLRVPRPPLVGLCLCVTCLHVWLRARVSTWVWSTCVCVSTWVCVYVCVCSVQVECS
jgi:hypothetical protein